MANVTGAYTVVGESRLTKSFLSVFACLYLAACAQHPQTDDGLRGEAENAVDRKLDTEGTFTLMESVAAQQIACGHVFAAEAPGRGRVDQDFVYLHGRLIMDDDPDYDQAATECDVAASGGNSSAVNTIESD